jgi:DNA-binding response OmpR family regulator
MRIILVEDDLLLSEGIISGLRRFHYQVEHCTKGTQLLSALEVSEFAAVILDLGLLDGCSLPLIDKIRKKGLTIPILVLTALDDIENKLQALNAGADDYMIKPFDLRELEVRLRVLARRFQSRVDDELCVAGIRLNLASQHCDFLGKEVALTKREFMLMREFMQHPDRIRTRQHLEELSYGWEGEVDSNAIEVHIHNLRKKFDAATLKTIRSVGYMLVSHHAE